MTLRNMCAIYCYNIEKKENMIERIKSTFEEPMHFRVSAYGSVVM